MSAGARDHLERWTRARAGVDIALRNLHRSVRDVLWRRRIEQLVERIRGVSQKGPKRSSNNQGR